MARQKKLKVAVLGAGMIGDVHVDRLRRDGRAEVTWIAARTERTLREKAEKLRVPNATLDYREALGDRSVDAVVVAAPPHTHLEMAVASLRAGKHLLLEKPMVATRGEMKKLLAEAAKHPQLVVLDCSCRHARLQPKFDFVKKILDSGEIGEVYHLRHRHLMRSTFIEYNPRGAWALDRAQAGAGPVFDWGVYDLSFHLGLLGDVPQIRKVTSFVRGGLKVFADKSIHSGVEEHMEAFLELDGGLTYSWERGSGVHMDAPNETRIYGTRGALRFAYCSWDSPEIEVFGLAKGGKETRVTRRVRAPKRHDDNLALTKHFLDCVLEGAEPRMPLSLAAKHLDILFRVLEGAR